MDDRDNDVKTRRNKDGPKAPSQRGPDLKRLTRQLRDMESIRSRYFPVWQEIAKYIVPGRGVFTKDEPNQGERKDRELLDPTPLQALHVLSAGLQGGLTSPSRPWFRLGVADGDLSDFYSVRLWLDEVERRIFHVLSQSNVYNALHTLYQEIGAFGVGAMLVEEDANNVVRAHTFTAGEFCLSYGLDGLPNRFGREFWMSAQQMEEEFGEEALSDAAKAALKSGRLDQWFRVCQMIYPGQISLLRYGNLISPFMPSTSFSRRSTRFPSVVNSLWVSTAMALYSAKFFSMTACIRSNRSDISRSMEEKRTSFSFPS